MTSRLLLLLVAFFCAGLVPAQNSKKVQSLKKQQTTALQNIKNTNQQINKTQKTQLQALHRLEAISTEIAHINDSIKVLNAEMARTMEQEKQLTAEIADLERSLAAKKESYAKAVRSMTVRRDNRYDALMFILSASSLDQAYRRFRYLQEFSSWRKQEAKEIVKQRDDLNQRRTELLRVRKAQGEVLALRTAASQQLIRQQREQRTLVAGLRKKERTLKQELKKQQQQADALGRRIQEVIEEEARKAAEAAAAKKKNSATKPSTQAGYQMSKDEEQLSRNFAQNRGKLPTPLSGRYRIIAHFGTQQHPDLKYVKINNQGIDMQTQPGTKARSVFDGVVTSIFVMPGYNTSIIVRHGEYLTIYSNLSTIYVKTGDRVKTGQELGIIYSDPEEDNRTVLHFQIRKETTKLDPELWLKK
ncbi:MAG TPA: peptidoglycan DD-metalloendopeptidase family protein [Candidatus Caccoplasma merdavium]|nr:peptidoglycan DD-metalloendopeptidase family protein [Candidatus Caccoplasma merdavium]